MPQATRTLPQPGGMARTVPAWHHAPPRITGAMVQHHGSYAKARAALAGSAARG